MDRMRYDRERTVQILDMGLGSRGKGSGELRYFSFTNLYCIFRLTGKQARLKLLYQSTVSRLRDISLRGHLSNISITRAVQHRWSID